VSDELRATAIFYKATGSALQNDLTGAIKSFPDIEAFIVGREVLESAIHSRIQQKKREEWFIQKCAPKRWHKSS
jgi:hypothetical protein